MTQPVSDETKLKCNVGTDVSDVMRCDFNSDALHTSLEATSKMLDELDLKYPNVCSRQLSKAISARKVAKAKLTLCQFAHIKEQLNQSLRNVDTVMKQCDEVLSDVQEVKKQVTSVVQPIAELQNLTLDIDRKLVLLDDFFNKYRLTANEISALNVDINLQIGDDFFDALERVKKIHADAKEMSQSSCNTTGVHIMEQMANHMNAAYDNLYRWVQRQVSHLRLDSINVSRIYCKAYAVLQDRPTLLQYALEEYCMARRLSLVHSFVAALSKGSTDKPIDIYSNEPVRYVGTMLAWIHDAVVQEGEALRSLLKLCSQSVISENLSTSLGQITKDISHPFKVRVEQTLAAPLGPIVAYQLYNMFVYYLRTIEKQLPVVAELVRTLDELRLLNFQMLKSCVTNKMAVELKKLDNRRADLLPSASSVQLMMFLRDIVDCPSSVALSTNDARCVYEMIYSTIVDGLMHKLVASGTGMATADFAAYMLNNLNAIRSTVAQCPFSERWLEMLDAQMETQQDAMSNENAVKVLGRFGLLQICLGKSDQTPPAQSSLDEFYAAAKNATPLFTSQWNRIQSAELRSSVANRSLRTIRDAYDKLYRTLSANAALQLNPTPDIHADLDATKQ